jgi:MarR family transcriptional repressor of emrRAB
LFYLRDLPDEKDLREFTERYPKMDPSAMQAAIALARTGSDLLTGFESMLSTYGLSQGRFLTLMVMNRTPEESANPSQLAYRVGVTRSTMTGLLDGLHRDGLIDRTPHNQDRRRLCVRLTRKGRDYLESILPDYYRRAAKLMSNLTDDERMQLVRLLGKVNLGLPALTEP